MAIPSNQVAEMQGLYGPFTVAERVVQKIWLRGDFDRHRAVLTDGRKLKVRSTGAWNLLGGPDFRNARVVIDGREATGDVEVHFHAADWRAHGHGTNEAYANVVLHVVLFPPGADEIPARRADGQEMPTLVLLPLLHRDLEEYASDDALEGITDRDEWRRFEELGAWPGPELQRLLRGIARQRWRQKVHFAKLRMEKLGWTEAAHHTALEILGYRQNRAAMLAVAARHPLKAWIAGAGPAAIYAEGRGLWRLAGVRPANHPLVRLQQYQRWVAASPDWPEQLAQLGAGGGENILDATPTKLARQLLGLKKLRENLAATLLHGTVGGTRLDNLVCDGFLPFVTARREAMLPGASSGVSAGWRRDCQSRRVPVATPERCGTVSLAASQDEAGRSRWTSFGASDPQSNGCFALWFHWFAGDGPDQVRRALPKLGVTDGRLHSLCHGYAQGLLGWLLERETRASGCLPKNLAGLDKRSPRLIS
jgi:hypothetical protein